MLLELLQDRGDALRSTAKIPASRPGQRRRAMCAVLAVIVALMPPMISAAPQVTAAVRAQIEALKADKRARTPAQRKIESHLIYYARQSRGQEIVPGIRSFRTIPKTDALHRVLVDVRGKISPDLTLAITSLGGRVQNQFAPFNVVRAYLPVAALETLAARSDVNSIRRATRGVTHADAVVSEGVRTHDAAPVQSTFGVTGVGLKIGVISDGVDSLSTSIDNGELNASAHALTGAEGSGDEGTAMMEVIHDLVPDAELIFATAGSSQTEMATNILALQTAGCTIIVDDVTFNDESPFQPNGDAALAVATVSDAGIMYFSAARNSGNKDHGTSGTWEGDWTATSAGDPGPLSGANLMEWGGSSWANGVVTNGSVLTMYWSDPWGYSANDYDIYDLSGDGNTIFDASTDVQDASGGDDFPYEQSGPAFSGEAIAVDLFSGSSRFLHVELVGGTLQYSTEGSVRGHGAMDAANLFCVAATDVANSPDPDIFTGGVTNPIRDTSGDGPRRMFFDATGADLGTPGDYSSTGGIVIDKPDFTAADGVSTSVAGYTTFNGTSAAAAHAAGIAALIKSVYPTLTPADIRTALTDTALDIEDVGSDRNSGAGIIMAQAAVDSIEGVRVTVSPDSTTEGSATDLVYTFTRTGPTDDPLVVNFDVGGSATFSTDYTQSGATTFTSSDGTVTIAAGETTATISISSSSDAVADPDETVVLTVTSGTGYVVSSVDTATGTFTQPLSANANLSDLIVSPGGLTGDFSARRTSYVAVLPDGTTSVTVTPTVEEDGATVTVNGVTVASGDESDPVEFGPSSTTISVIVTAPNGTATKLYLISLRSTPVVGSPTATNVRATTATLGGTVTFDGNAQTLRCGVVYALTADQPDPRVGGPNVHGERIDGTAGGFSIDVSRLEPGRNYSYAVYATNRIGTVYSSVGTFTTDAPSSNASLSGLVLSTGTLSPAFASGTTAYTATVANSVANITVTPTAADRAARIRVNRVAVASGSASGSIPLVVGANKIRVRVAAQDGETIKVYTITVTRAAP